VLLAELRCRNAGFSAAMAGVSRRCCDVWSVNGAGSNYYSEGCHGCWCRDCWHCRCGEKMEVLLMTLFFGENGGGYRGGWSLWLKLGLGFHV